MKTNISIFFMITACLGLISCEDSPLHTSDDGFVLPRGFEYHLGEPEFAGAAPSTDPRVAFSEMVQVGEMYFLSGQIGKDPETNELVPGGIEAETRQLLLNIKNVLGRKGIRMTSVVKTTVILDDIDDFNSFNKIFMEFFPQRPARTTFAAESLARGAKIEIDVIAVQKASNGEN
jgi:2-iminobutanoate/2-iminopropanoate deaminase